MGTVRLLMSHFCRRRKRRDEGCFPRSSLLPSPCSYCCRASPPPPPPPPRPAESAVRPIASPSRPKQGQAFSPFFPSHCRCSFRRCMTSNDHRRRRAALSHSDRGPSTTKKERKQRRFICDERTKKRKRSRVSKLQAYVGVVGGDGRVYRRGKRQGKEEGRFTRSPRPHSQPSSPSSWERPSSPQAS
jgi:hypothetical protein